MREPNFAELLTVLERKVPSRPTLFEFFLNGPLYQELAGKEICARNDELRGQRIVIQAFKNAGYDYATAHPPEGMRFTTNEVDRASTISLNAYSSISDRASFERYLWPEPDRLDYSLYDRLGKELPDGMKLVVCGPGGVLENVIKLVGYEALCLMTLDDPELARDVFAAVGSRLLRHYELAVQSDAVGALISNDDWGFKSQTMLSPEMFRELLIPWHRKIAAVGHAAGKPVILHSCGNLTEVMDDIIDDIGYDGKHSYEDAIQPVEEAYEQYHGRIAIMGGLDLDFICRESPENVRQRARAMLERSAKRGAYALGTGNSVPEYVPRENYFAMLSAALDA